MNIMKNWKFTILSLGMLMMISCSTSRSASEDGISEKGIMDSFDKEKSGSKIIYTEEEKRESNYDVETSVDTNVKNNGVLYTSLVDRLRKIGGLTISGTGDNVSVVIRGMSSIVFSNQPIYVIDGFNVGRDYARANNSVDVNRIKSIRVLKGAAQTAAYGEEGKNGVILIKTE
jgi:TonB-dependent SusC/RagA subfamily outer membrane receptor